MQDELNTAIEWQSIGVATIPVLWRSKSPALPHWKPYTTTLPREAELRAWFANSRYGIAVVCGWRGLVVVDFDDMTRYSAWLAGLQDDDALVVLRTYRVTTARGMHIYLFCDETQPAARGEGLDVKSRGGYVLAPPTIHPNGTQYTATSAITDIQRVASVKTLLPPLVKSKHYESQPPSAPPDEFGIALHGEIGDKYAQAALQNETRIVASAMIGGRNRTLYKAAFKLGQLVGCGALRDSDVADELRNAARQAGLGEHEIFTAIRSGLKSGEQLPRIRKGEHGKS